MPRTGTGRIFQRGEVWWIDYSHRGKRYRESSGSTKKRDATALLKKRMGEQASGKVTGPREERLRFEDIESAVLTDYKMKRRKSIRRVRLAFKHLRRTFAGEPVLSITDHRVRRYVVGRQEEGAADSSIQKELAALRRGFRLLNLSHQPKIPNLNPDNVRTGFFGPGELERLVEELPDELKSVVRFGYLTGWRKSEVLSLQWSQVDFEAGIVRLDPGTTKNREGRVFPFRALPPLLALLEEQRERTRALEREQGRIITHVFHRNGKRIRSMINAWRSACSRAGLEGWLFHDLRRSAVRNLVRSGVPEKTAMELVGHKTRSVFSRYNIVNEDDLADGVAKLAKLHQQEQGQPSKVQPIRAAQG